jgi:predicted DNA-binding protein
LIGLKQLKEAAETIKKALSIKFSRSLYNNLKEIEEKTNDKAVVKVEEILKKEEEVEIYSFFNNSLFKFFRVVFISSYNFIKRNRNIILLLILLCIIVLRKKINFGSLFRVIFINKK